jgi:hypothetical protein
MNELIGKTNSRLRLWLRRGAVFVIVSLVSLTIAELLLRTFAPIYLTSIANAYQYDSDLGFRLRPAVHMFRTTDFQQEIRVNQLGTVNFQEKWDDYDTIVFAAGDSFTQGSGLPADASYPAQLDLMLNEDAQGFYAKKFGVVNLGLAAFGGKQSLIAVRRWASLIRPPKYILYLGCDNDYVDDVLFDSGYSHSHLVQGSPSWGWLVRPMQWLTNDLQIGLRMKLLLSGARRHAAVTDTETTASHGEPSTAEREAPSLQAFVTYAREHGATLIVGWSEPGRSYDWLKAWSAQTAVLFADWAPKVASVTAAIPTLPTENPHSGRHHRGWVNRVIAEEYARQIRMSK